MEIIPAIDIMDGQCVRLEQGDYGKVSLYHKDPVEVARKFEGAGLLRLHLVDLDGARTGQVRNWKVLENITSRSSLRIDFGGGIKTEKDVNIVFNSGAALATVGSIAVKNAVEFSRWLALFGAERFLLGADVRDEKITVSGWQEQTDAWVYDFIQHWLEKGIVQMFCTDVSKDGRLAGPATGLYKSIVEQFPALHFIASGGISSLVDLEMLQKAGCKGAIVGKAIYENRISLQDLHAMNQP
jgi:phosphoribosylformimino-5-aminoimidazole carboxamide ribotide isomerase